MRPIAEHYKKHRLEEAYRYACKFTKEPFAHSYLIDAFVDIANVAALEERLRIVEWLQNRPYTQDSIVLNDVAEDIERGEHLK